MAPIITDNIGQTTFRCFSSSAKKNFRISAGSIIDLLFWAEAPTALIRNSFAIG
jgi:hypothetical protein